MNRERGTLYECGCLNFQSMAKSRRELEKTSGSVCMASVAVFRDFIIKVLDSADASDMATKKLYLHAEAAAQSFAKESRALRDKNEVLTREMDELNEKLNQAEEQNRRLSSEAHALHSQLKVIREVLNENDLDKARERLAEIDEEVAMTHTPTPKRWRQKHSAGSLIDSDNASPDATCENEPKSHNRSKDDRTSRSLLSRSADIFRLSRSPINRPGARNSKRLSQESDDYCDLAFKKCRFSETETDGSTMTLELSSFKTPHRPMVSGNRLTRAHQFTSISSLRLPLCSCCGKRFALGKPALRCKVCRLVVHEQCQEELKQRCVPPPDVPISPRTPAVGSGTLARTPRVNTVRTLSRRYLGTPSGTLASASPGMGASPSLRRHVPVWHSLPIASFCPPNEFPQVPAPVIHCVNEVAARGFLQVGIYRVPGSEKRVYELLDKLLHSRTTPPLALVNDINVVCSCLKSFLRMLDEPLVTLALRPEFIAAAKLAVRKPEEGRFRVAELLEKLPIPNRDTLAYLILHLKAVARSPACKMSEANLAKVFGYTVVGHSRMEPTPYEAAEEVSSQLAAVRLLLSVPDAVYSKILG